jgi:hypothetical protein
MLPNRPLAYLLVTFAPLSRGPDQPPRSRVTTSYVSQTHTNENISPLEGIVNLFYPTAKAKKLNDKYTTFICTVEGELGVAGFLVNYF